MNTQSPQGQASVILYVIISVLLTAILVGGGVYLWQKSLVYQEVQLLHQQIIQLQADRDQFPVKTSGNEADGLVNWQTYTYSNVSFKYPQGWDIENNTEASGRAGFDISIIPPGKEASGYRPDGLDIRTYDNSVNGNSLYVDSPNRIFTYKEEPDNYIKFTVNSVTIYAGCGYYTDRARLDICNHIASTIVVR